MLDKQTALSYKEKIKKLIDEKAIVAFLGISKNLDGDYIVAIRVSDDPKNVDELKTIIASTYPDVLYDVQYVGTLKMLVS